MTVSAEPHLSVKMRERKKRGKSMLARPVWSDGVCKSSSTVRAERPYRRGGHGDRGKTVQYYYLFFFFCFPFLNTFLWIMHIDSNITSPHFHPVCFFPSFVSTLASSFRLADTALSTRSRVCRISQLFVFRFPFKTFLHLIASHNPGWGSYDCHDGSINNGSR